MKVVSANITPSRFERNVLSFVIPQILLTTAFLSGAFAFSILYFKLNLLFIVPVVLVSLFFSILMFRTYVLTNYRVLAAFSTIYDTFSEGGKSTMTMFFPKPTLLFLSQSLATSVEKETDDVSRMSAARQTLGIQESNDYIYVMKFNSPKYSGSVECTVPEKPSGYKECTLRIKLTDWSGRPHEASISGNVSTIGTETKKMANRMEQQVLAGMA